MIREVTPSDAPAITSIYNHYVEHSYATMQYELSETAFFEEKIKHVRSSGHFWLVVELENEIVGYAYSAKWNPREGYNRTCEISVYLSPTITAKGWGTKLYTELFERLREKGMMVIIAVIGLPNEASIALHEKFGMKKVAHFPRMGFKLGNWMDVGYWQVNYNLD